MCLVVTILLSQNDGSKYLKNTKVIIDVVDKNDPVVICTALDPVPPEDTGSVDTGDSDGGDTGDTEGPPPDQGPPRICTEAIPFTDSFSMYEDAVTTTPEWNTSFVVDRDDDVLKFTIDKSIFDGATFAIDESTARITVAPGKSLDYELKQYYKISVVVKDYDRITGLQRTGPDGTASYNFPIEILNANDAPVLAAGLKLELPENSQSGDKTTTTFAASDVDGGAAQVLTYTMTDQRNAQNKVVDYFDVDVDPTTKLVSVKVNLHKKEIMRERDTKD